MDTCSRYQGDIVKRVNRNGLIDPSMRWPNEIVCYQFNETFSQNGINVIREALRIGFERTCVKFIHRKTDCHGNYVFITHGNDGCCSDVGYLGIGLQVVNLGEGCDLHDTGIHEFTHSLGFVHQQSSSNRDDYIEIVYENIETGMLFNFEKVPNTTSFGQPYDDYCSLMHYDLYGFTYNGNHTMILKQNATCGFEIGFAINLSEIDKNKINFMYNGVHNATTA
ncbi:hypothetical protein FQA39_LY04894 [Lamprigera yunnana]|nr:hypothetical protein FQA39_LY04894 [Lamprigera yunnana]